MNETRTPATRVGVSNGLKVLHEGPGSVCQAVDDLLTDLVSALWPLVWRRARRLNLVGAYRISRQVVNAYDLLTAMDGTAENAHLVACVLALSVPAWIDQILEPGTRAQVLGVADYTGWAMLPD